MKMVRAARLALGSPDHKALLAPQVLQSLDSKLLQSSKTLTSQILGHVLWVPAGVSRQAWCTTKPLSLAKWLMKTSPKDSSVLSAHLAKDTPRLRSIHVCPCCVDVLLGTPGVWSFWNVFLALWGPGIRSPVQNRRPQCRMKSSRWGLVHMCCSEEAAVWCRRKEIHLPQLPSCSLCSAMNP